MKHDTQHSTQAEVTPDTSPDTASKEIPEAPATPEAAALLGAGEESTQAVGDWAWNSPFDPHYDDCGAFAD